MAHLRHSPSTKRQFNWNACFLPRPYETTCLCPATYHTPSLSGPRPTMTSRVVNIHLIWFSTLICTSAATIFITSASASSRERQRKTCLGSVISSFQFDPFCCRATTCLWSFQSIPNDIGENENEQRKKNTSHLNVCILSLPGRWPE